MKPSDKFKEFLSTLHESVNTEQQKKILEAVTEAYTLLEANPYIWQTKQAASPVSMRDKRSVPVQSKEEITDANKERERKEKLARQASGRLKGVQSQLLKAAQVAPMEIEAFLKSSELRDAIKAGKEDLDRRFGTSTAKRSFTDRLKGAVRGFTEAEEEFIGKLEDED